MASFIGAFFNVTPVPLVAVLIIFVIAVAVTRHISAGSILAAATFPLAVWMIDHPSPGVVANSLIAGAFIIFRHKANLERLRSDTEHVFRWRTR